MGFDLMGLRAKNKRGEYFRNNVWYWRPLWDYVAEVCPDILTGNDITNGTYNNGHKISHAKADKIALRLTKLLASGEVLEKEREYKAELEKLPMVECELCHGTGLRDDEVIRGKCNGCSGLGKRKDWATLYPFESSNVQEFMEFCRESGGFEIC